MECQFGDDFLLQDADPVGKKTSTTSWKTHWLGNSGKRSKSAAANGPKTQRQTGQERSGKRLGGRGPKPIFEAIMGHASSRGEEGEEKRVGMKVTANDIKCSGKRQAKIAANGQKPQRQTKKTIGSE